MNSHFFVLLVWLVLWSGLHDARSAPPVPAWKQTFGTDNNPCNPADAWVSRVILTTGGNVVTAGVLRDASSTRVLNVWKHNPAGSLLWSFDDSGRPSIGAAGAAEDERGNIFAIAWTETDTVVVKLTAAGVPSWRTVYEPGDFAVTRPVAAVADAAGGVYVAGWVSGANGHDVLLVRFDNTGAPQWVRRYDGTAHADDEATAMIGMPGGDVVVAGFTTSSTGGVNFLTNRYSANGTVQWENVWDSPAGEGDKAQSVLADSAGNLIVGGQTGADAQHQKVAVLRLTGSGNLQGTGFFRYADPVLGPDPFGDFTGFRGMALDGTGKLAIAASSIHPYVGSDHYFHETAVLASMTASGAVEWQTPFYGSEVFSNYTSPSRIGRLIGSPAGGFFVGGYFQTDGAPIDRRGIIAISSGGVKDWAAGDGGIPFEGQYITGMAVGPDGHLYTSAGANWMCRITVQKWLTGPMAPEVVTGAADAVAPGTARGNGTVRPGNLAATWWFEYGTSTAYGSQTTATALTTGADAAPVSAPLSGLTPGTLYHYRLAASNSAGTAFGSDQTFSTTLIPPYQLWTVQHFGASGAPGSARGDDPDSDGLTNAMEFAFGGDPLVPGIPSGFPVAEWYHYPGSDVPFLAMTYTINPAPNGVQYLPEAGSSLQAFSFSGDEVAIQILPNNRRRAVAFGSPRFMRVRVIVTP